VKFMGNPLWKDPRYQEAVKLYDMSGLDEDWGMPSDPHARENLRHATGYLAAGTDPEDAGDFLELVLARYLGAKYQNAARGEIRRLARSAVLAVRQKEKEQ